MDAIISIDGGKRILVFNPAAEKMFGVPASDALGQAIDRFIPAHFGDFGRTGLITRPMNASGALSGLRANGEEFPVEASISQVEVNGEWLFTVILRDITERKKAETRLIESQQQEHSRRVEVEALMEAAPAFVWISHDPECRVITGNQAGQAFLRISAGENASKTALAKDRLQHFEVFKDGRRALEDELPMQKAGRTGKPVLGEEQEIRFADGTCRWVYGNAVPLLKDDGTPRGVVATFVDITELKRAEEEVSLSRKDLRALAGRLQAVREEERTRVAREIHDVLAQELTRIKLDLSWASRRLAKPLDSANQAALHDKLAVMLEAVDTAIASVQRIATELRPVVLDSLGLSAAIEWQAKDFEARTEIESSATVPDGDLGLDRDLSTAIFRILQESLTNVARHAAATKVEISLQPQPGRICLTVRDNGRGIQAAEVNDHRSLGLLGMRERAALLGGECLISGGLPGQGTTVVASFPLAQNEHPVKQVTDENLAGR
jgi:hypothetical protein